MVFSSLTFLYIFLPVCLVLYNLSKNVTYKNVVLLIMSLAFYAYGEPKWILIMLATVTVDYVAGIVIDKYRGRTLSKFALVSATVITLGFQIRKSLYRKRKRYF